jgi:hypothetical protein
MSGDRVAIAYTKCIEIWVLLNSLLELFGLWMLAQFFVAHTKINEQGFK